jgi:hypothetical protein
MNPIKQFKLANGEELLCEVIEWPDEESPDIIVRNSYKIISHPSASTAVMNYYVFKPWMIYQDHPDHHQVININHIVGEANPTEKILEHYFKALKDEDEGDQAAEELADYIQKLKQMISGQDFTSGDSDTKVIAFPGRTIH